MSNRKSLRLWMQLAAACGFLFSCGFLFARVSARKAESLSLKTLSQLKVAPPKASQEHLDLPGTLIITSYVTDDVTKLISKAITKMRADGTQKKLLKLDSNEIALSPDGKKIAFVRGRGNKVFASAREARSDLYVADSDGTNEHKILTPKKDYPEEMAWTPDSRKIAFTITNPYGITTDSQIWLINSDGTGMRKLTHNERDCFPCFSPNGKTMVFASGSHYVELGETRSLYLTDARGKIRRRLTIARDRTSPLAKVTEFTGGDDHTDPVFSRDGKSIAFVFQSDATIRGKPYTIKKQSFCDIYIVSVNGKKLKRLTWSPAREASPVFTPDGQHIAYLRDGVIWIMNTNGSNQHKLESSPMKVESFDWR